METKLYYLTLFINQQKVTIMKKLRLLLALFVASIGAVQSASARVAPELPAAQTLTSGQEYYLYNVMEGKFLCKSSTDWYYAGLGTYGDKVTISATDGDNEYVIAWADNNYHLTAYDTYVSSSESGYYWDDCFVFAVSGNGYTIQRTPRNANYYKADEFIGFNGSNGDRLSPALTEGSIYWQLWSVEDAEYYFAKHKLFTYLNVADQYNFYITQYEQVYENPASTTAELDFAQATLKNALDMSENYVSPSWTEYPILFQNNTDNKWQLDYNNTELYWEYNNNYSAVETTSTLKATVNVDGDATLCYSYRGDWYSTMRVYLDGELVQIIYNSQAEMGDRRYYIEMSAGKHDITWTCLLNDARADDWYSHYQYLSQIGIVNTPTITPATTTVEGQLGTEVRKLVDPVSSVKKIVINGVIGEYDWTTISLMVNAFSIDMSGATATAPMPGGMFYKHDNKWQFLHDVKLPQGLTAIGGMAFYESDIENEMTFPESLKTIGPDAFYKSKIRAAYMPEGVDLVYSETVNTENGNYSCYGSHFSNCYYLENVSWPSTAAKVHDNCFNNCRNLRTFTIPEGVTEIGENSFQNCWQFNPRFPSSMNIIGREAFRNTATDSLFINENMPVYYYAFANCGNLVYAEWPTTFVNADYDYTTRVVANCNKLNKVKLKSPTMVTYESQNFLEGNNLGNITLLVPDFLEPAYALDPYWYQCNVEGFNSADQTDWILRKALTLNEGQRIGGTPNINMQWQSTLTFNGDTPQTLGNLEFCKDWYNIGNWNTMILSNTNNVNISGTLKYRSYTPEKRWVFLCLPFDTKVGDIVSEASYAIRYYDGAQRANNGTGGNWKNYEADDIIPAGTGFILQTSKQCSTWFTAQDNASKNYVVSNNEFVKALEANPSDVNANKGWNLVGNPWATYYNIHKLNFTAPITVWNGSVWNDNTGGYGNYEAYSIIDDDYAIKPLEAIFVQCPDEISSISFPIDGRQLTDVIESQNAARAAAQSERKLIDVVLSSALPPLSPSDSSPLAGAPMSDKTRFVLNPQASMDYEISCDASKFFSMDGSVPQIYTVENGTQMAINERPLGNGTVQIGFRVAQDGQYTITAPRNQFQNIVLVDNETGIETDLSNSDGYAFSADAGTWESRFVLRVGGVVVTGIDGAATRSQQSEPCYNLQGQRIAEPQKGLYIVNGKKVMK